MTKPKILITGGAGHIGASLAQQFCRSGRYELVVVDNLQSGSTNKLPKWSEEDTFIRADVNNYADLAPVFTAFKPDFVFHYAATVGVARTLKYPTQVLNDIDGLRNVLTLSKGTGVKRVFYASSSEVYGEPVEMPQREETTPLNSRLPYAVVKNLGEIYFRTYESEYGLPYTIFRFFNTYGPLQSEDFVISRFVGQALRGEDLTIYGDGQQSRTFCYVDDSVEFQLLCLEKDLFVNDTVNVGSEVEIKMVDLAELVRMLINPKVKVVHRPPLAEGDMTRRRPENSRMKQALGRELVPLSEGIVEVAKVARERGAAEGGLPMTR